MKMYKRHLPKLVSELIIGKSPKAEIEKFVKEQGETKEGVLQIAKSPDYICQKSAVISSPRQAIDKEINLIEKL